VNFLIVNEDLSLAEIHPQVTHHEFWLIVSLQSSDSVPQCYLQAQQGLTGPKELCH